MHKRFVRGGGFTLIELMVGLAVAAIIVMAAAPSFRDFMVTQRLRSINAQLVTDLQYARAEAASRNQWVRIAFRSNAEMTCYTIYTSTLNSRRCNCLLGQGGACTDAATREIKTVQVPRSTGVRFAMPPFQDPAFAYEQVTGGISSIPLDTDSAPLPQFQVRTIADASRTLWTTVNQAGRLSVCAPAGSTLGEAQC